MRTLLLLSLTMLLSACSSAEWHSINRKFKPTSGDSRLIDAKQRAIISVTRDVIGADGRQLAGIDRKPVTDLVVCAEPSPDALQATAAALAGTGSGSFKALEAVLTLSVSTAESAASIGLRTQTIQLLRDAYFRLCEAFLNDGLDSIAYDILQRRFQNQIIALLAVEQLTGAVKADQAGLGTSATGDAGAQTGLIAGMLETAEEDLLRLQKAQDANETKLVELNEKKKELESAKTKADADLNKNEETKTKPDLQQNAAQAQKNLESNATEIKVVERRKTMLEGWIERKNQQITILSDAFNEAAKTPITSNASGQVRLNSGDTTSSLSHTPEVVNAVRAITLNAINQDYEAQVCFETLRYRNNVTQFKRDVNRALTSEGEKRELRDKTFIKHCKKVFREQVKLRKARAKLINNHADAVKTLIEKVSQGFGGLSADDAVKLIFALSQAAPTVPGTAFLSRSFDAEKTKGETRAKPDAGEDSVVTIDFETASELGMLDYLKNLGEQKSTEAENSTIRGATECDAGKKLNAAGTTCVARCAHDGVVFDPQLDECVPKVTGTNEEADAETTG